MVAIMLPNETIFIESTYKDRFIKYLTEELNYDATQITTVEGDKYYQDFDSFKNAERRNRVEKLISIFTGIERKEIENYYKDIYSNDY